MNFPPVEVVKITRQFVTVGPVHCFQLSLHPTPDSFYGVCVGSCVRIDKVLRMVHYEMNITAIVQVEVGQKPFRNDESSGFNEVLLKAGNQGFSSTVGYSKGESSATSSFNHAEHPGAFGNAPSFVFPSVAEHRFIDVHCLSAPA